MWNHQQPIDVNELKAMAMQIEQLENQGADLSSPWYEFSQPQTQDLTKLQRLLKSSYNELTALSEVLDNAVRDQPQDDNRDSLQHAYNLVQELLQSRAANQTLLETMLSDQTKVYSEYVRALSLKEKAAAKQAAELVEALSKAQLGSPLQ